MPQLFTPAHTLSARVFLVGGALLLLFGGSATVYGAFWSDWYTRRNQPIEQPVPFSHAHHVGGLGIDCRYCHSSVESSPYAGIPPTQTCGTCHAQMWIHSPMLQPVRQSWDDHTPMHWNRVHDLPDYVYFDHSIHVAKGVGCSTCHGDVTLMPLEARVVNLQMRWCIDCHRDPAKHLRPQTEIYNPHWTEPTNQYQRGLALLAENHLQKDQLTNCSVCHR